MSKGEVLGRHKVYLANGMFSSLAGGQECMENKGKCDWKEREAKGWWAFE